MSGKTNSSGISPVGYNVLVEPREALAKTKGGVIIPDTTREKDQFAQTEGVIVAQSPMAFTNPDWPDEAPKPGPGTRVVFSRYAANEVKGTDGRTYWLMKDESIVAVMAE